MNLKIFYSRHFSFSKEVKIFEASPSPNISLFSRPRHFPNHKHFFQGYSSLIISLKIFRYRRIFGIPFNKRHWQIIKDIFVSSSGKKESAFFTNLPSNYEIKPGPLAINTQICNKMGGQTSVSNKWNWANRTSRPIETAISGGFTDLVISRIKTWPCKHCLTVRILCSFYKLTAFINGKNRGKEYTIVDLTTLTQRECRKVNNREMKTSAQGRSTESPLSLYRTRASNNRRRQRVSNLFSGRCSRTRLTGTKRGKD